MMISYRGVAFPWLCDQQGHLTTSQYMLMFDTASYHLIDQITRDAGDPPELSWADVRHEIDYRHEVAVGALVMVRSAVVRLGTKSITHRHQLCATDGETVHAELLATSVRFDRNLRSGAAISTAVRARAEALLADNVNS